MNNTFNRTQARKPAFGAQSLKVFTALCFTSPIKHAEQDINVQTFAGDRS